MPDETPTIVSKPCLSGKNGAFPRCHLPAKNVEYNRGDLPVGIDPAATPSNGLGIVETIRNIERCGSWMVLKFVEQDPAYRDMLHNVLAEIEPHWGYFWRTLAPHDQRALALLPVAGQADPAAIRRLVDSGVVRLVDEAPQPLSPAFGMFVRRQAVPGLLQAPPVTIDPEQRLAIATHVIENSGTREQLRARVEQVHAELTAPDS